MQSLNVWLQGLGLERYASILAENEVDFEALRLLSAQDLQDLGLLLGPRKKLLKAIADLNGAEKSPLVGGSAPALTSVVVSSATAAERRQLTVMLCDLVGSTELAQTLDPEQLRELMRAYQESCGHVVERYEGHVAQYLGDGLMVYFGWPKAYEDDGERAVRAGLEILSEIKKVGAPQPLCVRIGIATGPVVVGETGGGDASVPKLAVGETPGIAARLQGIAGTDQIVIGPTTQRLLGAAFEYQDLGAQRLKGIVEPMRAWQVLGASRVEGRFEAAHGHGGLTPLIGREEELALLLRRWDQAKDGEGQTVLLFGEPGIGKSRVTRALRERIANDPHVRLRYQCSPFHTQSALYTIMEQIEYAAGFLRDDSPEQKLEKLEALIRHGFQDVPIVAPLFAALLSFPADRYSPLSYSPQKQKLRTLEALVEHIEGLATREPVLLLFEDVHWIDPTSLEALDLLISRVRGHRILVVITSRPEFHARWTVQGDMTLLTMNRLSRKQAARMVENVTGGRRLPDDVLEQIVAKTDGVPLFVEELTKSLLEAGFLKDVGDRYEAGGSLRFPIPSTLQDSLMARLDRLVPAKEVAQIGACIGRDFSYELLAAVSPNSGDQLRIPLQQLVDSELVFVRASEPDAMIYTFKHALVRDVAYASLLKSRRQTIHRTIAEALEERFPERVANEPEVVAYHFAAAALDERAVTYWLAAAGRASDRFANTEAIHHAERGLESLRALPVGVLRDKQELLLQMALGSSIGATRGYTPPVVGQIFARARELCQSVGEMPQMLSILFALWIYYIMRAEHKASAEIAEQVLELSRKAADRQGTMVGHYTSGGTALFVGRPTQALADAEAAFALYDRELDRTIARNFAFDIGPGCPDWASCAAWILGFPDRGRNRGIKAVEMARELGHPLTVATIVVHAAFYEVIKGEPQAALEFAREAISICKHAGILIRQIEAEIIEGWALAEQREINKGVAQVETSILAWQTLGAQIANPVWYSCLGRALWRAGRLQDAQKALECAFDAVEKNNERMYEAELHRLAGELWLAMGERNAASAKSCFKRAMEVASSQGAKMLELRAATSLARLWKLEGNGGAAFEILFPIYNWFTEGFDTRDLKDAKALLDELR